MCDTCGKSYSRKDRLTIHIQEMHDDVTHFNVTQNRFRCPFCSLVLPAFRKMADLLSHCKMEHNSDLGTIYDS